MATTPGQGPATRLVMATEPKNSTKGAPIPVTGSSSTLNPNAAATMAALNA